MHNGTATKHTYVFGDFVNDLVIPCALGSGCPQETAAGALLAEVVAEEARTTVNAAVQTWP